MDFARKCYKATGSGLRCRILLHVARVKKPTAMRESHVNHELFMAVGFLTCTMCKMCDTNHIFGCNLLSIATKVCIQNSCKQKLISELQVANCLDLARNYFE